MFWKNTPAGVLSMLIIGTPFCHAQKAPPATPVDSYQESFHGVVLIDPYHWLEDSTSSRTRRWIDAQNAYAHSLLDPLPIRATILNRLTGMLHHDELIRWTSPRNGYYYFLKRLADKDLASLYRRKMAGDDDELLLDSDQLSRDHSASISLFDVSDDGALVGYGVRQGGQDETDLRILEVKSRRDLPDRLPKALYRGFAFKHSGSGFFYTVEHRDIGQRLYYHAFGSTTSKDIEVFGEGIGADTWIEPAVSENGRYLIISVQRGWARGDLYFENIETDSAIRPLAQGLDATFHPSFAGDFLLLQTDWKARKGRVLRVDLRNPARENWREIVPEREDSIQGSAVINNQLFITYLHNVASRILCFSLDGKPGGDIPLPGIGVAGIDGRADQREGIYYYSSFTRPFSAYRYDTVTGATSLWYQDAIPFQPERFETEQVWYSSKDGTKIPMFLIHRKGLPPDGKTPTILYGYGGFNVSIRPFFNPQAGWWIEHGGLYAVANIRGGGEFGEEWHRAGMLDKKQNVFDDFIAAAEWLISHNYTNPQRLGIWGGSNGGLLVAAALTQRPNLFQAVLCWHPDLDMVRYYKYTKNNNPPALLEYGNAADPVQFKFLYAYSPYEGVRKGVKYPAVLLESGDADTRVPPEQARKMTARLQAATASDRPILLLYDSKAGHAGGQTFSDQIKELTDELTFVAWQLNSPQ